MNYFPKLMRLTRLFALLKSGEKYLTVPELAKRLEVSTRTIFRYLQCLGDYGLEIDNECGYRIRQGTFSLNVQPNRNDLRLIQELIETSPLAQFPLYESECRNLLLKLECLMEDPAEDESVIQYTEPVIGDRLSFSIEDLEQACGDNRVCELSYQALDESEPSWRIVHPYGAAIRNGQWYLIALDEGKNEYRKYHFLRIREFRLSDRTFVREEPFDFNRFFEDSWSVFHGPLQSVRMRVRDLAARLISERSTPKEMKIEWHSETEATVSVEVRGEQEILNWALSMGPLVEILEPESLRERVRAILVETLLMYEK